MDNSFQFHDGMTLPKGSRFAFPIGAIMQDPDNFESPQKFDGFRFARLAEELHKKEGNDSNQQYSAATATKTNLA
jgi:cytochrome P450